MNGLDEYFTRDKILRFLAKKRASLAKSRSEDHLLSRISQEDKLNYEQRLRWDAENSLIIRITPPRRSWVNVGAEKRYLDGQRKNTVDKNAECIFLTIKRDERLNPTASYLKELEDFLNQVKLTLNSPTYRVGSPSIRPELKELDKKTGKATYRPIASFGLKDNLIIGFVNKYLTKLLDPLFYSHAFAFRATRQFDAISRTPNHHDAFRAVLDYSQAQRESRIFVAECDMKKFFDTVNHRVVMRNFVKLLSHLPEGDSCDPRAAHVLKSYLGCYNFARDVRKYDNVASYFRKHRAKVGTFGWVRREIFLRYFFFPPRHIGIPQGGALSGLIANIVLCEVDDRILPVLDEKVMYIRYCDDMILFCTDQQRCKDLMETYQRELTALKLFPHKPEIAGYGKAFWKAKTKGPYEWSPTAVPWVGFVGYEVNRSGDVRVRKRSLGNERRKQIELVDKVIESVVRNDRPFNKYTLAKSIGDRMIGMSVGRVELWNHTKYRPEMCWVSGFQHINDNKWTRRQTKFLDRSRNKHFRRLVKRLGSIPEPELLDRSDDTARKKKTKNAQIVFRGKPFSYFYQAVEKNSES